MTNSYRWIEPHIIPQPHFNFTSMPQDSTGTTHHSTLVSVDCTFCLHKVHTLLNPTQTRTADLAFCFRRECAWSCSPIYFKKYSAYYSCHSPKDHSVCSVLLRKDRSLLWSQTKMISVNSDRKKKKQVYLAEIHVKNILSFPWSQSHSETCPSFPLLSFSCWPFIFGNKVLFQRSDGDNSMVTCPTLQRVKQPHVCPPS